MDAKFKKGDKVVVKNHPDKSMIGKVVVVSHVAESKFREGVGYEDQPIYRVTIGKKVLGWAPEEDLEHIKPNEATGCDKCGGRIGLIRGKFTYEPDEEPYSSGKIEEPLFSEGDVDLFAYKCDECGHIQGYW